MANGYFALLGLADLAGNDGTCVDAAAILRPALAQSSDRRPNGFGSAAAPGHVPDGADRLTPRSARAANVPASPA